LSFQLSDNIYGHILDLWEAHSTLFFEIVQQQVQVHVVLIYENLLYFLYKMQELYFLCFHIKLDEHDHDHDVLFIYFSRHQASKGP
jgi:hypothetical protein